MIKYIEILDHVHNTIVEYNPYYEVKHLTEEEINNIDRIENINIYHNQEP